MDTACDLWFGKLIHPKTSGGHFLRFVVLGNSFAQKITGDTACDLRFRKFTYPKTYGGHCLRFEIW